MARPAVLAPATASWRLPAAVVMDGKMSQHPNSSEHHNTA
jgi:hypothetical protein